MLHYQLPNARANVSFLPLLATPLGRRPYQSAFVDPVVNMPLTLVVCLVKKAWIKLMRSSNPKEQNRTKFCLA